MSAQQIRNRLDDVMRYLQPCMSFVNCHMVDFITKNLWDLHVPLDIRNSIHGDCDITEALDLFWNQKNNTKFAALNNFMKKAHQHCLDNFNELLVTEVDVRLLIGKNDKNILSIKEFMSEKKKHEVETMANLITDLIELQKSEKEVIIVDAGDGKGYLSSRIALQSKIKVLGIDANEVNTKSAKKRNEKLERAWNSLTKRAELASQGVMLPRRGNKPKKVQQILEGSKEKTEHYKIINEFITPQLDLAIKIKESFNLTPNNFEICLCGLHTCGNLAATCLEMFTTQDIISIFCNVGCCYHLLEEEFSPDDPYTNKEIFKTNLNNGFPLSNYMRQKEVKLGRNARMLAAQSIHRTRNIKHVPSESLFYRALLEVLIREHTPPGTIQKVQVGKIQKFSSFREYVEKCDKKLNLNLSNLGDLVYKSLLDRYDRERRLLELFYLIRMSFASVIETVILLDRLLYLKERDYQNSFIVPLFDAIVSPRRFAIVSMK